MVASCSQFTIKACRYLMINCGAMCLMLMPLQAASQAVGDGQYFNYIDDSGKKQIAHVEDAYSNLVSTHDPRWFRSNSDGSGMGGPYDWLTYRGTDGQVWQTKIHLKSVSETAFSWDFESKHPGQGDGKNGGFALVGWDGVHYVITGLAFTEKDGHSHQKVKFLMRRE
jgi:hypothetical protein